MNHFDIGKFFFQLFKNFIEVLVYVAVLEKQNINWIVNVNHVHLKEICPPGAVEYTDRFSAEG